MLLEGYKNHPEAKGVVNDGSPCKYDTRGSLQRAHLHARFSRPARLEKNPTNTGRKARI